jgi:hypothetical protein
LPFPNAVISDPGARRLGATLFRGLLWAVCGTALFLMVHNFGLSLLPRKEIRLDPAAMRSLPGSPAFSIAFTHSSGDTRISPRSRISLTEDGVPLSQKSRLPGQARVLGGGIWSHTSDAIIFSSSDNTDPRTNGRRYVAHSPWLYSRAVGYAAMALFVGSLVWLRHVRAGTQPSVPAEGLVRGFWPQVIVAGVLFGAGLYLNTGTLAPYANTLPPIVDTRTGYLYNIDHSFHRTLYAFVAGEPRETWEKSLLLRRMLHATLARPWMDAWGYELGGVVFNGVLNLLGFVAGVAMVVRHVGRRGAVFAAWLLALYPGAHYWVGQPYYYGVIFPLGIAAFWLLLEMGGAPARKAALYSLALGMIYLAYDFHAYFVPASLLLLAWQRRIATAALSLTLQVLPLLAWLWVLKHVVRVPLENSNSGVYTALISSFVDPKTWSEIVVRLGSLPEVATDVFFGANFIFLPLLLLAIWGLGFKVRLLVQFKAVTVLLLAALALFVFCNLPPAQDEQWNMRGSWIARIYQPIFPALVLCAAVWWQHLLPSDRVSRSMRYGLVALVLIGNAFICFGPALGNPLLISGRALYRFYDHTDMRWNYPHNLATHGRRPLGFPRPVNSP